MNNIRLLPVVITAIGALLLLKTVGLVSNGSYVLTGVSVAQAAGGGSPGHGGASGGETITLPAEPTIEDTTPTLGESVPTIGQANAGGHGATGGGAVGHGAAPDVAETPAAEGHDPVANVVAAANACDPRPLSVDEIPSPEGQLMVVPADCPPLTDALPQLLTQAGPVALGGGDNTVTEQAVLERLAGRRTELESYEQELAMRASLVEAAEKRIGERQATLQSIENQIASLVEQRKQMEEGQFAGIVAMYETMKPKDAAKIFDNLEMDVLLRVSKMMSPRKMAPILAEMTTTRAQELTVRLASADSDPLDFMAPEDLAVLPQIVGQ